MNKNCAIINGEDYRGYNKRGVYNNNIFWGKNQGVTEQCFSP